ncbi:hypothetical protein PR048_021546 [Dryococelus australis]|uniref:Uncharacterized protein n=1 Tax=Dryococelus australis TaxID=614101 RepID=A0ABQ9GYK3_9NEOP|nr:hypothetical protein PR048_021546 [Dryococelus australis]
MMMMERSKNWEKQTANSRGVEAKQTVMTNMYPHQEKQYPEKIRLDQTVMICDI